MNKEKDIMSSSTVGSHNATEFLTPQQLQAVGLLLSGLTVTAVAKNVHVSRETVHRWRRDDCAFIAAINQGKQELHEAAQSRLQSVWWKAADNLATAVEAGNVPASLVVLRGLGELSGSSPLIGTTDPQRLSDEKSRHERTARAYQRLSESLESL